MTTARDERAPARDAPPPRRRAGTSPGSAGARAAAPIRLAPTATQPLVPGSAGRPLGAEVARSIGLGLGVDVSAVRVHDDAVANQAADERGVRAFAYGTDVYLARGERATDLELMAHEVAHIVQQRGRPVVQLFTTVQTADSLEHEAQSAATAVASGGAATVEGRTETRPQGSIIGRIRGFVSDVVDWVEDRFWDLVRMVAPDLEPILRNFGKWLEEKIAHAFRWVVDKVMAPIRWIEEVIGNVTSHFGDMVAAMKEAAEQIRRGDCHSIADAAGKIVSLVKALGAPIVDRIKDIAGGVAGFFSKLWDKLKDVWGWLKELGGVAGRLVVELGETLWEWTQPIRDAAARAWNWVKGKLGLDGGGGAADGKGGILNWIKEKAQAAWDGLQRFFEPVKKPLLVVAAVVVALSPVGPLLAVAAGAAGLVKGAQWLASKLRDREAIVREHGYLRGVLIPGIMSVVGRVTSAISSAANTAVTVLSRVVGGLGAAVGALAGTVFELVTPLVRWLLSMFTQLVKWAGEKLSGLADWVITGLGRLRAFLQPLLDVISAVGAVIADVFNIVKLIFTKAWHLIPPCIRDPIVNFIRDQILKRIPIFSQLLEIPDIWTKVKETALTIIGQIFKHGDLAGAALTFFRAVLSILSIPLELVTGIFTKAASALGTIVRSPIRFLRSVLGAMWQGFKQFFGKILKYLLAGVLDWLTGQLKDAAIEVPSDWSFAGIVKLLLSVLGVTLEKIWKLLGDKIGKPVVEKLKKAVGFLSGAWEWVGALLTEGPAGLWKKLKEEVGQLKEMMVGAIAGYLSETLIVQASVKILTALNPVGAIVNAIILAYKAIQTAAQYARQILEIVSRVLDVASDLAAGAVGGAADVIETLLGKGLTIAIGFLANYLNLGGFGRKVAEMVKKIQDAVEKAIGRIIDWAVNAGRSVLNSLGFGGKADGKQEAPAVAGIAPVTFTAGGVTHRLWVEPGATGLMVASKPVTVVGYVAALSQRIQNLPGTDPHKAALTADIAAIGPLAQQLNVAFSSAEGLRAPKKEDADRYRVLVERMRNLIELASEEEHAGTIGDPIPITWYKPWSAYQPFTIDVRGTSQTYTAGSRKDLDVGGMFADLDTIGGKLKIGVAAENRPAVDKTLKRVAASARPLGTADRFVQVLATFGFSWSGRNADHVRDLGLGGVDDVQNLWPLDAATNRAGNRIYDQWVWVKDGDDVKVSQLGRLDNLWFRIARMQ